MKGKRKLKIWYKDGKYQEFETYEFHRYSGSLWITQKNGTLIIDMDKICRYQSVAIKEHI